MTTSGTVRGVALEIGSFEAPESTFCSFCFTGHQLVEQSVWSLKRCSNGDIICLSNQSMSLSLFCLMNHP